MSKNNVIFILACLLGLFFIISVCIASKSLFGDSVFVVLLTIGSLISLIWLTFVITNHIEKKNSSEIPVLKIDNDYLLRIDKNSISTKLPIGTVLVDVGIAHDGVIDPIVANNILEKLKRININKILEEIVNHSSFRLIVKHHIKLEKFKLSDIYIQGLETMYIFDVDDDAILCGIEGRFQNDELQGVEFPH